jgi:YD repeat-containing protein
VVKIDGSNNATTYQTYNANSKMTKSWDALTKATVYAYDNLSRITSVTDPNGDATSFTYNKNGATATATRPNSLVITNNYDKAAPRLGRSALPPHSRLTTIVFVEAMNARLLLFLTQT